MFFTGAAAVTDADPAGERRRAEPVVAARDRPRCSGSFITAWLGRLREIEPSTLPSRGART